MSDGISDALGENPDPKKLSKKERISVLQHLINVEQEAIEEHLALQRQYFEELEEVLGD